MKSSPLKRMREGGVNNNEIVNIYNIKDDMKNDYGSPERKR